MPSAELALVTAPLIAGHIYFIGTSLMLQRKKEREDYVINPLFIFIEKNLKQASSHLVFSKFLEYKKKEQTSNNVRIQNTESREVYFIHFSTSADQEKFFEHEYVGSHLSIDKYLEKITLKSDASYWSHAHLTLEYKNYSDNITSKFHIYYDQFGKILEYTAHTISNSIDGKVIKTRWLIKKEELSSFLNRKSSMVGLFYETKEFLNSFDCLIKIISEKNQYIENQQYAYQALQKELNHKEKELLEEKNYDKFIDKKEACLEFFDKIIFLLEDLCEIDCSNFSHIDLFINFKNYFKNLSIENRVYQEIKKEKIELKLENKKTKENKNKTKKNKSTGNKNINVKFFLPSEELSQYINNEKFEISIQENYQKIDRILSDQDSFYQVVNTLFIFYSIREDVKKLKNLYSLLTVFENKYFSEKGYIKQAIHCFFEKITTSKIENIKDAVDFIDYLHKNSTTYQGYVKDSLSQKDGNEFLITMSKKENLELFSLFLNQICQSRVSLDYQSLSQISLDLLKKIIYCYFSDDYYDPQLHILERLNENNIFSFINLEYLGEKNEDNPIEYIINLYKIKNKLGNDSKIFLLIEKLYNYLDIVTLFFQLMKIFSLQEKNKVNSLKESNMLDTVLFDKIILSEEKKIMHEVLKKRIQLLTPEESKQMAINLKYRFLDYKKKFSDEKSFWKNEITLNYLMIFRLFQKILEKSTCSQEYHLEYGFWFLKISFTYVNSLSSPAQSVAAFRCCCSGYRAIALEKNYLSKQEVFAVLAELIALSHLVSEAMKKKKKSVEEFYLYFTEALKKEIAQQQEEAILCYAQAGIVLILQEDKNTTPEEQFFIYLKQEMIKFLKTKVDSKELSDENKEKFLELLREGKKNIGNQLSDATALLIRAIGAELVDVKHVKKMSMVKTITLIFIWMHDTPPSLFSYALKTFLSILALLLLRVLITLASLLPEISITMEKLKTCCRVSAQLQDLSNNHVAPRPSGVLNKLIACNNGRFFDKQPSPASDPRVVKKKIAHP